jgi:hypothetical protein
LAVAHAGSEAIAMHHVVSGISCQFQREACLFHPSELGRYQLTTGLRGERRMPELMPPQTKPTVPVTAQELRTSAAADKDHKSLVPAGVGNAQAAKTAMDSSAKTVPSHLASTLAAGQDRVGNAAIAGAAMRVVPMAVPKKDCACPGH